MATHVRDADRNFDDLAERFSRNVYGGLKGRIRLAVLQRDFSAHLPIAPFGDSHASTPLRILDAGGGQAQFSLPLAQAGHQLVICDISREMLALARSGARELGVEDRVDFIHGALQDVTQTREPFDLILCHAVMEWMAEPEILLPMLCHCLKPGGHLSLTYYNLHSLIYKNLLRTNFKKILNRDFAGSRGSLTPLSPIDPADVDRWLHELPMSCLCRSGIRVFHDYIFDESKRERSPDELLAMELQFSTQEPYRSLGRYIHMLLRKNG